MVEPIPLSVIIPTFNRSGFVRDCLTGLRRSGVPDLEIIVVDDGSTDDTAEVVAATEPKAIYLSQDNAGPAAARNRGFRLSRGRHVAFLDCDDQWYPEAPAKAVKLLERHPEIDLLFAEARMGNHEDGYVSWINSGGQDEFFHLPHRTVESGLRILERGPLFRRMAVRTPVFIGAVIMKREAFVQAGAFDGELCGAADWNLWLRMAATMTFAYWHEPLAIYTKHLDGMSNDRDGMSKEFCMTLRKLPAQVTLAPADRQWVAQQLRHHLIQPCLPGVQSRRLCRSAAALLRSASFLRLRMARVLLPRDLRAAVRNAPMAASNQAVAGVDIEGSSKRAENGAAFEGGIAELARMGRYPIVGGVSTWRRTQPQQQDSAQHNLPALFRGLTPLATGCRPVGAQNH